MIWPVAFLYVVVAVLIAAVVFLLRDQRELADKIDAVSDEVNALSGEFEEISREVDPVLSSTATTVDVWTGSRL